jgi:hypothetical protein
MKREERRQMVRSEGAPWCIVVVDKEKYKFVPTSMNLIEFVSCAIS